MSVASIASLSVFTLICACSEPPAEPSILPTVSGLDTVTMESATVIRETAFDGQVEAINQSTVSAQTSGRVQELPFDVGDTVNQGDLIVRITSTEQQARVESATAAVAEASVRLGEARAQYRRIDEIYQQRLVSKAEFDSAVANLNAAKARLEAAQAALSEATQAAEYAEVYAPFSGMVVSKLVELGETVVVGTPLMSGLSLQGLRAAVDVPQEHMGALREHRKARVILADGNSLPATGLRLPPNADPNTHTFRVLVNLPEEKHGLFPGTLVKIAFVSGKQQQLLLPATALVHRGEVTGSYVLDDGNHLSFRYVRVGTPTPAGSFPVLSGIEAGEQVATDPIAASRAYRGQSQAQGEGDSG